MSMVAYECTSCMCVCLLCGGHCVYIQLRSLQKSSKDEIDMLQRTSRDEIAMLQDGIDVARQDASKLQISIQLVKKELAQEAKEKQEILRELEALTSEKDNGKKKIMHLQK